ncbi:MAG: FMN-binding negative transcriptional regulator [Candidatus Binataceae bacterium]
MYIPKAFEITEKRTLHEFIEAHSFATLVSNDADGLFASHVPLTLNHGGSVNASLAGHFARANPHWRALEQAGRCIAIFTGPHSYISPSWYESEPAVPTWNYAAVHVYGKARIIYDSAWVAGLLDRMIAIYEARQARPWPGILPVEFRANLAKEIVGFEIEIDRFEGKFKLGQNRPLEDQRGTLRNLERSDDATARELASLARHHLGVTAGDDNRHAEIGAAK